MVTVLIIAFCHVILNLPYICYLVIFYYESFQVGVVKLSTVEVGPISSLNGTELRTAPNGTELRTENLRSYNRTFKLIVTVICPLINCLCNVTVYFIRMMALRMKLFHFLTLLHVQARGLVSTLKQFCRENNRVVPSETASAPPVYRMNSIELTEKPWFDSELAGEEQIRYASYLYSEEPVPDSGAVGKSSCRQSI